MWQQMSFSVSVGVLSSKMSSLQAKYPGKFKFRLIVFQSIFCLENLFFRHQTFFKTIKHKNIIHIIITANKNISRKYTTRDQNSTNDMLWAYVFKRCFAPLCLMTYFTQKRNSSFGATSLSLSNVCVIWYFLCT